MNPEKPSGKAVGDGGPAFPMPVAAIPVTNDGEGGYARLDELTPSSRPEFLGMTLRDYFAAQALMGFIANSSIVGMLNKGFQPGPAAEAVYLIADAMLAERRKA